MEAEGQEKELLSASEIARIQDGVSYVDSVVEGKASLDASRDGRPGIKTPAPDISILENILADEDIPYDLREGLYGRTFEDSFSEEDFGDLDGDGVDKPDWKEREEMERDEEEEEWELW
ncbi:MAG: hypothetical protein LUD14_11105 [Clostridiales bacterium]|nr:hypothetical protein [Clostridiales bacterium]